MKWICAALFFLLVGLAKFAPIFPGQSTEPVTIAGHETRFDAENHLLPWISWNVAPDHEMRYYEQAPAERGYPRFATATLLDGN